MKNKRIMSVIAIVLLVGLYVSTLIFALIDSEITFTLLKISIAGTIFIPVLLYVYIIFMRLGSHKDDEQE